MRLRRQITHAGARALRPAHSLRLARRSGALLAGCVSLLCLAPAAALAGTASISGTVRSDIAGPEFNVELAGIEVGAYEAKAPNKLVTKTESGLGGGYRLEDLTAGEYVIGFKRSEEHALDFAPQFYPEKERFGEATHIKLNEGEAKTGVEAKLLEGASVSGTVTDAGTHEPVSGILVVVETGVSGTGVESLALTITAANGKYDAVGLPSGQAVVAFISETEATGGTTVPGPYISQVYNDVALTEGDSELESLSLIGTPVTLSAPATTGEINAALERRTPFDVATPAIVGTPAIGQLLTCSTGKWNGEPPLTYAYKWLRDGVAIASATASTYAVTTADQGENLVCEVTATNKEGSASAISSAVSVPAATMINTGPPLRPQLKLSASKLQAITGVVHVPVSCVTSTCAGSIELTEQQITAKLHKGGKTTTAKQTLVLGKGAYSVSAGHSATVSVRLTAAAVKDLAKARHHELSLELVATLAGGSEIRKPVLLSLAASTHK
jgi:hypothetical protein